MTTDAGSGRGRVAFVRGAKPELKLRVMWTNEYVLLLTVLVVDMTALSFSGARSLA
jgi:hypothetical protein